MIRILRELVASVLCLALAVPFLDEPSRVLKPGGRLYINYTIRNPFGQIDEGSRGGAQVETSFQSEVLLILNSLKFCAYGRNTN